MKEPCELEPFDETLSLEDQLREEADRLLSATSRRCDSQTLVATYRKRVFRRQMTHIAVTTAVLLLAFWGAATWRGSLVPDAPQPDLSGNLHSVAVEERNGGGPHSIGENAIRDNSMDNNSIGNVVTVERPVLPASGNEALPIFPASHRQPLAVPVLFTNSTDLENAEIIGAGFYVPEQVEQVDLRVFTPAEQRAIRQVLGLEEETISYDPL